MKLKHYIYICMGLVLWATCTTPNPTSSTPTKKKTIGLHGIRTTKDLIPENIARLTKDQANDIFKLKDTLDLTEVGASNWEALEKKATKTNLEIYLEDKLGIVKKASELKTEDIDNLSSKQAEDILNLDEGHVFKDNIKNALNDIVKKGKITALNDFLKTLKIKGIDSIADLKTKNINKISPDNAAKIVAKKDEFNKVVEFPDDFWPALKTKAGKKKESKTFSDALKELKIPGFKAPADLNVTNIQNKLSQKDAANIFKLKGEFENELQPTSIWDLVEAKSKGEKPTLLVLLKSIGVKNINNQGDITAENIKANVSEDQAKQIEKDKLNTKGIAQDVWDAIEDKAKGKRKDTFSDALKKLKIAGFETPANLNVTNIQNSLSQEGAVNIFKLKGEFENELQPTSIWDLMEAISKGNKPTLLVLLKSIGVNNINNQEDITADNIKANVSENQAKQIEKDKLDTEGIAQDVWDAIENKAKGKKPFSDALKGLNISDFETPANLNVTNIQNKLSQKDAANIFKLKGEFENELQPTIIWDLIATKSKGEKPTLLVLLKSIGVKSINNQGDITADNISKYVSEDQAKQIEKDKLDTQGIQPDVWLAIDAKAEGKKFTFLIAFLNEIHVKNVDPTKGLTIANLSDVTKAQAQQIINKIEDENNVFDMELGDEVMADLRTKAYSLDEYLRGLKKDHLASKKDLTLDNINNKLAPKQAEYILTKYKHEFDEKADDAILNNLKARAAVKLTLDELLHFLKIPNINSKADLNDKNIAKYVTADQAKQLKDYESEIDDQPTKDALNAKSRLTKMIMVDGLFKIESTDDLILGNMQFYLSSTKAEEIVALKDKLDLTEVRDEDWNLMVIQSTGYNPMFEFGITKVENLTEQTVEQLSMPNALAIFAFKKQFQDKDEKLGPFWDAINKKLQTPFKEALTSLAIKGIASKDDLKSQKLENLSPRDAVEILALRSNDTYKKELSDATWDIIKTQAQKINIRGNDNIKFITDLVDPTKVETITAEQAGEILNKINIKDVDSEGIITKEMKNTLIDIAFGYNIKLVRAGYWKSDRNGSFEKTEVKDDTITVYKSKGYSDMLLHFELSELNDQNNRLEYKGHRDFANYHIAAFGLKNNKSKIIDVNAIKEQGIWTKNLDISPFKVKIKDEVIVDFPIPDLSGVPIIKVNFVNTVTRVNKFLYYIIDVKE